MSEAAKWYVVHTYSGYENKVKEDLEKSIENLGMQDTVLEVKYPTEEAIEILPSGKKKVTQRKVFPGYVMVKMVVDVVEKQREDGGVSVDWVMNSFWAARVTLCCLAISRIYSGFLISIDFLPEGTIGFSDFSYYFLRFDFRRLSAYDDITAREVPS